MNFSITKTPFHIACMLPHHTNVFIKNIANSRCIARNVLFFFTILTASTNFTYMQIFVLGHYLFLEASGNKNKNAIIVSPTYTTGTYCFSAWYNMYGHEMGYLYFEMLVGGRKHALRSFHGDHGDKWNHFQAQINMRGSTPFQVSGFYTGKKSVHYMKT